MAAVVLQAQNLSHEIMAASPLSPNASRHGRSRRQSSSASKNKCRGRGYSIISERQILISKALARVLRLSDEQENDEERLEADSDGWVDCEKVLSHPDLVALQTTSDELEALTATPKAKFTLKLKPSAIVLGEFNVANYLVRCNHTNPVATLSTSAPPSLTALNSKSDNLPELIVYETSYANYPLILASGGLKRAGGQAHLSFKPISLIQATELPPVTADVSIYINLRSAFEAADNICWYRSETGLILTEGDADGKLSKAFWSKVVARRTDIGILFEDGEVKKEVPIGLRGKGVKPKKGGKGRGKGAIEMRAHGEDEETTSE